MRDPFPKGCVSDAWKATVGYSRDNTCAHLADTQGGTKSHYNKNKHKSSLDISQCLVSLPYWVQEQDACDGHSSQGDVPNAWSEFLHQIVIANPLLDNILTHRVTGIENLDDYIRWIKNLVQLSPQTLRMTFVEQLILLGITGLSFHMNITILGQIIALK